MRDIFKKVEEKVQLERGEVVKLLGARIGSAEYYSLLQCANEYSRATYENRGLIFAQIGIDAAACSVNCKFCQLAVDNFSEEMSTELSETQVHNRVRELVDSGADEIFLMCTAEYDMQGFLAMGKGVRAMLPEGMRLVANVGDFDADYALQLKAAGFTGVYHICRLGEGEYTAADVSDRISTLNAVRAAGLDMYYCVEPIGPEHTNEQIADEIMRGVEYKIDVMAVMRRVNFENSPMSGFGEITAQRLAQICAVTTLCVRPKRAMGVHEPEIISLISGANQIYAEQGTSPRDKSESTEKGRGFSVAQAQKMLKDAEWQTR